MSINYKTTSAVVLQDEIRKLGPCVRGLELGVWYGYNMGHLLEECKNIEMLYGVDPYLPYQDWNRYIDESMMQQAERSTLSIISNFPRRAHLLKMTSAQARERISKLDFIFIDGDHSYERCYEDLNLWYDTVRPGGLFSGHDFTLPGVNRAILQFRQERNITGFFKVVPNDVWFWIKD